VSSPVSDEVAGALGRFFYRGIGPSHSDLSGVFLRAGFGDVDPYDAATQTPSKEVRVQTVIRAAVKRPARSRELVEGLLTMLRLRGSFSQGTVNHDPQTVATAQRAFRRAGWALADDGMITVIGHIDVTTGGREALDEQLERLRRATDDPAQLLGSAKDLLEAVAKFVLEELGFPADGDFPRLWYLARDRLNIHPNQVAGDGPGLLHG
jgi:hypothetical protein